jgi:hypothetical protein
MTYMLKMCWIMQSANVRQRRRGLQPTPEKEARGVRWTHWLNAASTPAPKHKLFNESGSLEPYHNEDANCYDQAAVMMVSAPTVPVSGTE